MTLRRADIADGPDYAPPRSATERKLAEIWQEAMDIDVVGIDDDFFLLNCGSAIAAIIFARIQDVFGVKFPISLLVSAPTIALLAARIDERKG